MIAHAAAPAAGGVAGYLLVGLGAVVLYLVLLGMRGGYEVSLGALLRKLAESTRGIRWIGGTIADAIEGIDEFTLDVLGRAVQYSEAAVAKWFHGLEWVWRETVNGIVGLGRDVQQAFEGVVGVVIPDTIFGRTQPLAERQAKDNIAQRQRATAEAQARARGIDRVQRDLLTEKLARERGIDTVVSRIGARIAGLDATLSGRIEAVRGYTWRNLRAARARLTRVEQVALGGAMAAVALATITRVFPYWRCSNVRGFNRFLCRLPVGLLPDLLALTVAGLVLSDVCRMGRVGMAAARVAEPFLLDVVAVVDAATNCTSFPPPPALPLRAAALPVPVAPLALAV